RLQAAVDLDRATALPLDGDGAADVGRNRSPDSDRHIAALERERRRRKARALRRRQHDYRSHIARLDVGGIREVEAARELADGGPIGNADVAARGDIKRTETALRVQRLCETNAARGRLSCAPDLEGRARGQGKTAARPGCVTAQIGLQEFGSVNVVESD